MPLTPAERQELEEFVRSVPIWYHVIDLGDGLKTPGRFDMSGYLEHYEFPDMAGKRVLDVGSSSGYFCFEFERRGAEEVVAVDLPQWESHDWTPRYQEWYGKLSDGQKTADKRSLWAFDIFRRALGSTRVEKKECSIYDVGPERLGLFDLVFCGSMLMHVRDPVLGLQRLRSVCKPDGQLIVSIATTMTDQEAPLARFVGDWNECNWWQMNPACLKKMLSCCDFEVQEPGHLFTLSDVSGQFNDPTFVCHAHPRQS